MRGAPAHGGGPCGVPHQLRAHRTRLPAAEPRLPAGGRRPGGAEAGAVRHPAGAGVLHVLLAAAGCVQLRRAALCAGLLAAGLCGCYCRGLALLRGAEGRRLEDPTHRDGHWREPGHVCLPDHRGRLRPGRPAHRGLLRPAEHARELWLQPRHVCDPLGGDPPVAAAAGVYDPSSTAVLPPAGRHLAWPDLACHRRGAPRLADGHPRRRGGCKQGPGPAGPRHPAAPEVRRGAAGGAPRAAHRPLRADARRRRCRHCGRRGGGRSTDGASSGCLSPLLPHPRGLGAVCGGGRVRQQPGCRDGQRDEHDLLRPHVWGCGAARRTAPLPGWLPRRRRGH